MVYCDTAMGRCKLTDELPVLGTPAERNLIRKSLVKAKTDLPKPSVARGEDDVILGTKLALSRADLLWHSQLSDFRKQRSNLWGRVCELETALQQQFAQALNGARSRLGAGSLLKQMRRASLQIR